MFTVATSNTSWCLSILPSPGFCPHLSAKTDYVSKQKSQVSRHLSANRSSKWFSSLFWPPGYPLHSWCLRKLHRLLDWYMAIAVVLFEWQILKLKASSGFVGIRWLNQFRWNFLTRPCRNSKRYFQENGITFCTDLLDSEKVSTPMVGKISFL